MDWISVLPADCSEELLAGILHGVDERGWRAAASRGHEQVVVTISGADSAAEVAAVLPPDADLQALLSRSDYARTARRRWLMVWMVRGLGILVAFGALVPILGFLAPPEASVGVPDQILVGAVGDIPENGARLVRFQSHPVLVICVEGGAYFALSATCSYTEECQLEWSAERHQIVCPCHGDVFDIFGNVLQGPSSIPLRRYAVEEIDGRLYLEHEQ
jgi:nitrite reductase/ring-hydroxylating ferredoxin subunit